MATVDSLGAEMERLRRELAACEAETARIAEVTPRLDQWLSPLPVRRILLIACGVLAGAFAAAAVALPVAEVLIDRAKLVQCATLRTTTPRVPGAERYKLEERLSRPHDGTHRE